MSSIALDPEQRDEETVTTHSTDSHGQYQTPSTMSSTPSIATAADGAGDIDIEITVRQKMIAAMSGSFVTSLTMTPLDVVRVRLQSQTQPSVASIQKLAHSTTSLPTFPPNLGVTACCREVFFSNNNAEACLVETRPGFSSTMMDGAECAVEQTQRRTFNSTLDGMRKIARNEGITTLWRGLSPTLVMAIPANIIYFTGYEWLRFNPQSPVNRVMADNVAPLGAGATARTVAAIVVNPIEMLRTRMQASQSADGKRHFVEALRGIKEMVDLRGYSSLWRGLGLTLWRDVPFSAFYWWGYETARGALTDARERRHGRSMQHDGSGSRTRARSKSQSRENHTATFTDSFTAGASSGAIASMVTMPFDVGKTRQQVFKDSAHQVGTAPEQQSMPRFLLHIFKTEGLAGLWRGWIPRTLKVAPACAIMISSYEVGKKTARSVNQKALEHKRNGEQNL